MAPKREVRLDPLLQRDGAQLFEPGYLRLRERLVEEIGERGAAPEREPVAQRALGGSRVSSLERRLPLLRETDEAVDVYAVGHELEFVARRPRRDDRAECLTELRNVDLDGVRSRAGRLAGPERLHEPVDRDDTAGLDAST